MKRKKLFLSALAIITAFSLMIPSFAADPSFASGETGITEESETDVPETLAETETYVPETPGESEADVPETPGESETDVSETPAESETQLQESE